VFNGRDEPDVESVWALYRRGRDFHAAIGLDDTVRTNENFFVGRQWEGVQAAGLPTPVFNILKRDVLFVVSTITSDSLKLRAAPLAAAAGSRDLERPARIFTDACEAVFERADVGSLIRRFARDAAVRGDGCLYVYWDPYEPAGGGDRGVIRTETVENTRVYFGNPNDARVETQPFIQIESRAIVRELRRRARGLGCPDWESIVPDDDATRPDDPKRTDDKTTLLLTLWRDPVTGSIRACESTRTCMVRPPWDLGIRRYPLVWLNWDPVSDCCHGQAMITGLIPNQIFINKIWAMSMLSMMASAYPKVLYDRARIPHWSNRVGEAVGVAGGDLNSAARILDPARISPQIYQFIQLAVEQTNANLGATHVALGDARPDNTSAIIALQRAAATPSELTKLALRQAVEELALVYLEFMAACYGVREVDAETPEDVAAAFRFAGQTPPDTVRVPFDFATLRDLPMQMRLDVGASSYYSEIAAIQTMDNLLRMGKITTAQYLARIPDGYIPDRQGLLDEVRAGE